MFAIEYGRPMKYSHDHEGIEVLNSIEDRLDDMRSLRHLFLVVSCPSHANRLSTSSSIASGEILAAFSALHNTRAERLVERSG
jgi:hypothetical protein